MKFFLISILVFLMAVSSNNLFAQTPYWDWAKGTGGTADESATCMATDASGNVYVAGEFASYTIVFGTDTLIKQGNNTTTDIFIVKYDALGNVLWAKSEGFGYTEEVNDICTDVFGNVYITGYTLSSFIIIGSDTLINGGASGSEMNMFIAKYDSLGNFQWAKGPHYNNTDDFGFGIASDPSGNVFVSGAFRSSTIAFGIDTLINHLSGFDDIFVVKYDSSGNVLWAKSEGGLNYEHAYCATDPFGNLFISGYTASSHITFDTTSFNFGNGLDFFLVKYDASGNLLWVKCPLGDNDQQVLAMTTDYSGNVLITGYSASQLIVGSDTLLQYGMRDIFIIKYDGSGNPIWARIAGSPYYEYGKGISCDAQDNVYITGYYDAYDIINFGSIAIPFTPNNGFDLYFAKYDSSGNVIWAQVAGNTNDDKGICTATDNSGNFYLAGNFNSPSLSLGANVLTNSGLNDMFVGKIGEVPVGNYGNVNHNNIHLYPNPGTNNSSIVFAETQQSGSIMVSDIIGKIKAVYMLNNNQQIDLDISSFNKGIYLINIKTEKENKTLKLIKQ